jgi:translation initiation factor eIF-2B subunit delta
MSNGSILSRVGTASVALAAKASGIPVLVCGETYKISHRTQLESITNNEMGNPCDVLPDYYEYEELPDLRIINLLYDLTPSEFISGIVTEMGILPPTSVAVLLREMNPQDSSSASTGAAGGGSVR